MDDSCAVCADALEWVAYGPCGHREVCSTCVIRLRFVLDDRKCCICKVESPTVFVTKAMGDYTRVINDFSVFPPSANEGKVGDYWYHEDSQSYFDDVDQYKMIKATCRLSCCVCDNPSREQTGEVAKRRSRFRSIEQLKGHLFHQHKLLLCSLCLESRKVFICEQKLYTRSQLNRHISTGDSEVDGDVSERGGFGGHPMCQFCKSPFYGDNELYIHMSTDHFTCHICRRKDPGRYDYFKNYDDLENHFRHEHYLCEDETCLAEKFIVFQNESELKRHNAMKHGGNTSRSRRNAALTLPVSFTYRSNAEEHRRGRGRGFRFRSTNDDISRAIQASLEMAGGHVHSESGAASQVNAVMGSLESLSVTSDSVPQSSSARNSPLVIEEASFPALSGHSAPEPSGGYKQAVSRSRATLGEAAFPPLPGLSANGQGQRPITGSYVAHIHKNRLQSKSAPRAAQASAGGSAQSGASTFGNSCQDWPSVQQSASSSSTKPATAASRGVSLANNPTSKEKSGLGNETPSSSAGSSSSKKTNNTLSHSSSAPNLESMYNSPSNYAANSDRNKKHSTGDPSLPNIGDVRTANQSLMENIRTALDMDEDKFKAFRSTSAEYRWGSISAAEYLTYVQEFGLSHLVIELAQLCPVREKQVELVDLYNFNMRFQIADGNSKASGGSSRKMTKGKSVVSTDRSSLKEIKEESVADTGSSSLTKSLEDGISNTVKNLQENYRPPQEGVVEQLSKDGYRISKGKPAPSGVAEPVRANPSANNSSSNGDDSDFNQNVSGGAQAKQKKTSKFHRIRLGDGSAAALLTLDQPHTCPEHDECPSGESLPGAGGGSTQPVRGVWKKGGGQKLFTK